MNIYSVKQMADMAGVSARTLHYYDEKGLLKPSSRGENRYRYYDDDSLLCLQQILFYREMGLGLQQIKEIISNPDFDTMNALQLHRVALQEKIKRLQTLTQTVDTTIMHLIGEVDMSKKKIFEGFSKEKQEQYEKEAVDNWGDNAAQSIKLWNSYSDERKEEIMQEGNDVYEEIVASMDKGANSPEVQALLVRWHEHLRYFYEPTIELLGGLGNMYYEHADFNATFTKIDPALPAFLKESIAVYVDVLETRWLERELGILEE
jgi:MerR family transcriptional regulator, thiopeptide resistance regulator